MIDVRLGALWRAQTYIHEAWGREPRFPGAGGAALGCRWRGSWVPRAAVVGVVPGGMASGCRKRRRLGGGSHEPFRPGVTPRDRAMTFG